MLEYLVLEIIQRTYMRTSRKETTMLYAILSLVFLAAAIAIGTLMNKNTGVISIALSLILARIAGISDNRFIGNSCYSGKYQ